MGQKEFINIIIIMFVVLLVGTGSYFAMNRQNTPLIPGLAPSPSPAPTPISLPVACTQEARQCPDGSYVGRTGKNCEFAKCPAINQPAATECEADADCPKGYQCIQSCGPPVARAGDPPPLSYCELDEYAAKPRMCPICLAGDTMIDTPLGLTPVMDLRVGKLIWTTDKSGRRVSGVVQKISKVPAPPTHQMVHLVLDDGRELFASPGHPTIDGGSLGDLAPGDRYDGTSVVSAQRVPYGNSATYDVLPSGETGFYWANGVLLGSTLHSK